MDTAPLFDDIAKGPENGVAHWVRADDGVRLRVAYWPGGNKGTVLLFPGRTEYIEKYGIAAVELLALGYCVLTIDWRGQGLSDRLADDPMLGHVADFDDYQRDVAAMVVAADALDCPGPRYLVAHSMGGTIGLRALHNGLDVAAASFSGPMWGIHMAPALRLVSAPLTRVLTAFGQGLSYAPTTKGETYVKLAPFQDNMLTTDPDMYGYMQRQADAHPELTLAGPSVTWLGEALRETEDLQTLSAPNFPTIVHLGDQERIVDAQAIHEMMARWNGANLHLVKGCEHEIMMEKPATRAAYYADIARHFSANAG